MQIWTILRSMLTERGPPGTHVSVSDQLHEVQERAGLVQGTGSQYTGCFWAATVEGTGGRGWGGIMWEGRGEFLG